MRQPPTQHPDEVAAPALPTPVAPFDPEATIARTGRFRIMEEIGRGASGIVYRAWDPQLSRHVAVKVVSLPDSFTREECEHARARCAQEAAAAARLSHPNVVQLYDAGEGYLAMELLEGDTLSSLMSGGAMPQSVALAVLEQIAAALDYAHDNGVIHRDIKPANIIVTPLGAKVADFGVAKLLDVDTLLTRDVVGTPRYMSPEQVDGQAVSAATDNFALAVIAYELLTGQPAFPGTSLPKLLRSIVEDEPKPASRVAEIPRAVDRILAKGMAKSPARRYARASEMVAHLKAALDGAELPSGARRFPSAAVQIGMAIAAVAGIGLGFLLFDAPPSTTEPSAAAAAPPVEAVPRTPDAPTEEAPTGAQATSPPPVAPPAAAAATPADVRKSEPVAKVDPVTVSEPVAKSTGVVDDALPAPREERPPTPTAEARPAGVPSTYGFDVFPGSASFTEGVIVKRVDPGSVAQELGLLPKDVITTWNGTPITSSADLGALPVESPLSARVEVMRDVDSVLAPITLQLGGTGAAGSE